MTGPTLFGDGWCDATSAAPCPSKSGESCRCYLDPGHANDHKCTCGLRWPPSAMPKRRHADRVHERAAYARRTDPDTSKAAAARVEAGRLERLVLDALTVLRGATCKEVAEYLHLHEWSLSPRFKPLEQRGLIERTSERRGRSIVWRCV